MYVMAICWPGMAMVYKPAPAKKKAKASMEGRNCVNPAESFMK
jgi:hypothetical protein